VRLAADEVNRNFIPAFYRYLQAQEESAQVQHGKEFHDAIQSFVGTLERIERDILSSGGVSGEGELASLKRGLGLWIEGNTELGWADIMAAPCKLEASVVGCLG
jgi:glutathione S-transferase